MEEWFEQLKEYVLSRGFPSDDVDDLVMEDWRDFYEDGYTPEQAFWEDMGGG